MSKTLEIGQAVTITDAGAIYPFCAPAAKTFGLKNYQHGAGLSIPNGAKGTVTNLPEYFADGGVTLLAVDINGQSIIIDPEGVSF